MTLVAAARQTARAIDVAYTYLDKAGVSLRQAVSASKALGEFETTGGIQKALRGTGSAMNSLDAPASEVEDFM